MISISVIIPAYNRSATIGYCIQSILNQTYQKFEIIVVDDCSTDNTVEIIENISDNRLKIIKLDKNSGAQVARNIGIKSAQNEWIAFQDSDDEWLPTKLEKQINELEKVNFDKHFVIHGNCNVLDHEKNENTFWKLPLLEGECYKQLLSSPGPVFPSLLISKQALTEIGLLDEHVPSYQEWDTSIRLAKYCRFIHIQDPLFIYHKQRGETISKNLSGDITGYQYILNKNKDKIISICGLEVWRQHLKIQITKMFNWNLFDTATRNTIEQALILSLFKEISTDYNELSDQQWESRYWEIRNSKSFKVARLLIKPLAYFKRQIINLFRE
jgi:glycosyltransferase involved in cell wall biosynthesis